MIFSTQAEEGLYNLCFHACPNYKNRDSFNLEFDVNPSHVFSERIKKKKIFPGGHRGEQSRELSIRWRDAIARFVFNDVVAVFPFRLVLGIHFTEEQVSVAQVEFANSLGKIQPKISLAFVPGTQSLKFTT